MERTMNYLSKVPALAIALILPILATTSPAAAQTSNPNNEAVCDSSGAGSDPRCVGVVSPGGLRDVTGFRSYVAGQRHSSFAHSDYRVGTVLPETGVEYREVPAQFGGANVHYVIVNGHTVLTDRKTHRIVEVLD
jgi:hypothetical protein